MNACLKRTIGSLVIVLLCGTIVYGLHFSSTCHLEAVTLDGDTVTDWQGGMGLWADQSVLDQPLDSLADALLARDDIHQVSIRYRLPDRIAIQTNQFSPVAFVVSERTGKLYGLDRGGRVVPLEATVENWERPVLVNAGVESLFAVCRDPRSEIVLCELEALQEGSEDIYRLVAEVDFASPDRVMVSVSGLTPHVWVNADRLADRVQEFMEFVQTYAPRLDSVTVVDMRFADQIICRTGKVRHGG